MSDEITLRPVTADDLDLYEKEFSGPGGWGVPQWFGFRSAADLRRRFAENGLLGADGALLSVAEGDRTVGRVKWFPGTWGVLRAAVRRGGQWNDLVIYSVLRAERTGGTAK